MTSLTEVLAAHRLRIDYNHPAYGYCRCGFNPDGWDANGNDNIDWEQHVAEAIAAAGLAVVELPALRQESGNGRFYTPVEIGDDHSPGAKFAKVIIEPTPWGVVLQQNAIPSRPGSTDARAIAAALLAAANAAEQMQS